MGNERKIVLVYGTVFDSCVCLDIVRYDITYE